MSDTYGGELAAELVKLRAENAELKTFLRWAWDNAIIRAVVSEDARKRVEELLADTEEK